jgi:TPP-dependent pyruvate/acetoin dehydrogenase alpha subunit
LGILTDEIAQEMSAQVDREIEKAYAAAQADPMPSLEEVTTDVFA